MDLRRFLLPATLLFLLLIVLGSITQPPPVQRADPATAPGLAPPPPVPAPTTRHATMPAERQVKLRVGDLLELTVESKEPGGVAFDALGDVEPVAPGAPARFTFYAQRPGRSVVRMLGKAVPLGEVVVLGRAGRSPGARNVEA